MTTIRKLQLVSEPLEEIDDYEPLPAMEAFSLRQQAQRPGELCDWLELELSPIAADHVRTEASIPPGLWLNIAIEANRNLERLGTDPAVRKRAIRRLNDSAEERLTAAVCRAPARLLRAYADAVRGCDHPLDHLKNNRIVLTPATSTVTAWEHHARYCGMTLGTWVKQTAESMPVGRNSWEAAAAERGQTLAEWMARNSLEPAAERVHAQRPA